MQHPYPFWLKTQLLTYKPEDCVFASSELHRVSKVFKQYAKRREARQEADLLRQVGRPLREHTQGVLTRATNQHNTGSTAGVHIRANLLSRCGTMTALQFVYMGILTA